MVLRWLAFAASIVALGAACDLGISEDDIVEPSPSTSSAGGGGAGGETTTTSTTGGGGAVGGGGAGGTAPMACWGDEVKGWVIEPFDPSELTGTSPDAPRLSNDGLALTYVADSSGTLRPHQAIRASRSEPFILGVELASWGGLSGGVGSPAIAEDAEELYVTHLGDILVSAWEPLLMSWPLPTTVVPISSSEPEVRPSVTRDGLRMVFERQPMAATPELVEGVRQSTDPFDAWVEQPVDVPNLDVTDVAICPVLSADGLTLLFASNFGDDLTAGNENTAWKVMVTHRSALTAPWDGALVIDAFDSPTLAVCPGSVTEDGCIASFYHYDAISPAPVEHFFATRSPREMSP